MAKTDKAMRGCTRDIEEPDERMYGRAWTGMVGSVWGARGRCALR